MKALKCYIIYLYRLRKEESPTQIRKDTDQNWECYKKDSPI